SSMILENSSRSPGLGSSPSRLSTASRLASINLSMTSSSTRLGEHVDDGGLAALDDGGRFVQSRAELIGLGDRPEGVDVKRARDRRQIGRRLFDADADALVGHRPVAPARYAFLMLFVVVIGMIVEHHDQERNLIFRCGPERVGGH